MTSEITTLLGKDSTFEGKLTFEGAVRVDGTFKGEIHSSGTLVVGSGSDVNADVEVGICVIEGDFVGNLKAYESVEIHAPARVKGSVTTPVLQVEKGVLLDGKCIMGEVEPGGRNARSAEAISVPSSTADETAGHSEPP